MSGPDAHQCEIETPADGETFTTVLDRSGNTITKYTGFEQLPPTRCRFVRLTVTVGRGSAPLRWGFTVFGKPVEQSK